MAFADDVVLLTQSREELARTIGTLQKQTDKMGLDIEKDKRNFMIWGIEHFLRLIDGGG